MFIHSFKAERNKGFSSSTNTTFLFLPGQGYTGSSEALFEDSPCNYLEDVPLKVMVEAYSNF